MRLLDALPNRFLWWDPRIKERMRPEYAYPGFWTHCLAQCTFASEAIFAAAARSAPAAARATIVVNPADPAVNNGVARALAARWRRAGSAYDLTEWDGLGNLHDIIDPSTYPAGPALVYPRLAALLDG